MRCPGRSRFGEQGSGQCVEGMVEEGGTELQITEQTAGAVEAARGVAT